MRFVRVVFRRYGPFGEQELDFSALGCLHVIYGPNEAGKSLALRGLRSFLFGFPAQSGDDFRYKYSQFRIHATLANAAGQSLECIRRKGNKDTLRRPDDKEVLADRVLTDFIGGLEEAQFEQLFGLDVSRLVAGGQDIAKGKGNLGEALFAAGAGMRGLRELAQTLQERQEQLYLRAGKNQEIPKVHREYDEWRRKSQELRLPPETFAAAESDAAAKQARVRSLVEQRGNARKRLDELKRYQASLPTIALLKAARERLAPVAHAPLLSPDFDAKLEDARTKLTIADGQISKGKEKQKTLALELESAKPPDAILGEESEIDQLKSLVSADAKQTEEAVKATTFSIDEKGKARDIYRELTGTTDWEQMDSLKPRLDERQRITELANAHQAVMDQVKRQTETLQTAREQIALAEQKLDAMPTAPNPAPWQAVVDRVLAEGPLENQLREKRAGIQDEERRLAAEFSRLLPVVPGPWQDAPMLPVPLMETLDRFDRELDQATRNVSTIQDAIDTTDRELSAVEADLVVKAGAEPVPLVDNLVVARRDRDGGLHLIRRRLDGEIDQAAEKAFTDRHAPGRPVIDAAEASVHQCDHVADRLRHEADRVAGYATIQHKRTQLSAKREVLAIEAGRVADVLDGVKKGWRGIWIPSGISPDTPTVMRSWLNKWIKFRDRVDAWLQDCESCQKDEQRIAELCSQLADACPAASEAKRLAEGLALGRKAIEDATASRNALETAEGEMKRLQLDLANAEREAEKAERCGKGWEYEWSQAVAVLRIKDPSPSVKTAQDYLARIDQMQQHLRDMRIKDARVREIKEQRERIVERVNALRRRLDAACAATSADTLGADFRAVEADLRAARDQRTRHDQLAKQFDSLDQELQTAADNLEAAEATLAALATEAGTDVPGIPAQVQKARERAEVAPQIRQYEDALTQIARGQPLEEFIHSALGQSEGLDRHIEELEDEMTKLDDEVSQAASAAGEALRVLDGYRRASDEAAQARQEAALRAGRLEELAVEYAALHLAGVALDKAKERYRTKNQDTLLARAGMFFSSLTNGAFFGVDIDNDNGVDVLQAVRAAADRPDARVSVDGLSDGTRDQLLLALRLAGIERHLKDREPFPLIVDDVLVNFDDERTRATLKVLAELATKTQVLLFTHHRHVASSAQAIDVSSMVHSLALNP